MAEAATPGFVATTTAADAQTLIDYAQTLTIGDELMFTMDVPYAPLQETPIVLAQAFGSSSPPAPDFIMKECIETQHTPNNPMSALRTVNPAGMYQVYLASVGHQVEFSNIKVMLLSGPQYGKLTAGVDNIGRSSYRYDPTPGYVGNDRATFMVEFGGKFTKMILDIKVLEVLDEKSPVCPEPQLIKVNKPRSDLPLDGVSVSFSDLPNSALGQTTNTIITLDDNAAGHGWYIDYTPYLNEEYLPTSNSNEWVAKEGTVAYGKMDLLSVLWHEYGHALGLDHSSDSHDLMAATLAPGVRRLPDAETLAEFRRMLGYSLAG